MALFESVPPPPNTQSIVTLEAEFKGEAVKVTHSTEWSWQSWFILLRDKLNTITVLPPLGTANQILGVNSAGTDLEYKTLTDGNGIDITNSPGVITITVNQMELSSVLAFAAAMG